MRAGKEIPVYSLLPQQAFHSQQSGEQSLQMGSQNVIHKGDPATINIHRELSPSERG